MGIESKTELSSGSPVVTSFYRDWLILLTWFLILVVDQTSKALVKATLDLGKSWPRDGILRITHGTNTGSAFGLFQDQTLILTIASVIAIGGILYFYRSQHCPNQITRLTVGLLLGGACGNLIDRVFSGEVTDFFDVGWWPIFNIADSSIVIGMTLLIVNVLISNDNGKTSDHTVSNNNPDS